MAHKALNRFTYDTFTYKSIAVKTLECECIGNREWQFCPQDMFFSVDAACRF